MFNQIEPLILKQQRLMRIVKLLIVVFIVCVAAFILTLKSIPLSLVSLAGAIGSIIGIKICFKHVDECKHLIQDSREEIKQSDLPPATIELLDGEETPELIEAEEVEVKEVAETEEVEVEEVAETEEVEVEETTETEEVEVEETTETEEVEVEETTEIEEVEVKETTETEEVEVEKTTETKEVEETTEIEEVEVEETTEAEEVEVEKTIETEEVEVKETTEAEEVEVEQTTETAVVENEEVLELEAFVPEESEQNQMVALELEIVNDAKSLDDMMLEAVQTLVEDNTLTMRSVGNYTDISSATNKIRLKLKGRKQYILTMLTEEEVTELGSSFEAPSKTEKFTTRVMLKTADDLTPLAPYLNTILK